MAGPRASRMRGKHFTSWAVSPGPERQVFRSFWTISMGNIRFCIHSNRTGCNRTVFAFTWVCFQKLWTRVQFMLPRDGEEAAEAGWIFITHSELPVACLRYHFSSSSTNHLSGLLPSMVGWCVLRESKPVRACSLWWFRRHLRPRRAPGSWLWTTMIVLEGYRCAGY